MGKRRQTRMDIPVFWVVLAIAIFLVVACTFFLGMMPCSSLTAHPGWNSTPTLTPTPYSPPEYTCGWHSQVTQPSYCGGTCREPYVCEERELYDGVVCDCYNPTTGNWDPEFPGVPFPTPTPNLDQPRCGNNIEPFRCVMGYCLEEGHACQSRTNEIEEDYCACVPAQPCGGSTPYCNGYCAQGYVCEQTYAMTCACVPYDEG